MDSLKYDLVKQGFPFGNDDIELLNKQSHRAAALFMMLGIDSFALSNNYIITGISYNGSAYSAGFAYIGGHVVVVPATTIAAGSHALKLKKVNELPILWDDGQTRNSIYEYQGEIVADTGAADQYPISGLTRLDERSDATINTSDFSSSTGLQCISYRDVITLQGQLTYTPSSVNIGSIKLADLPSDFVPSVSLIKQVNLFSSAAALANATVNAATNELTLDAELNQNDVISIFIQYAAP